MYMPTELCRMKVSELQQRLAQKATDTPDHRFTNLYDLLTWEPLMAWAFDALMPASATDADGTSQKRRDAILAELRAALKAGTYDHQPVHRERRQPIHGKRRQPDSPTLPDQLVQLMVKAILEPIFESDFRPESHGLRPERGRHTALAHLVQETAPRQQKAVWIVRGGVAGCFGPLQWAILMRLLRRRVQDKKLLRVIWRMLRAGIMEGALFAKTAEGELQSGIIAPLLANVYLHELDMWFHRNYTNLRADKESDQRKQKANSAFYLRYADDFAVAWSGAQEGATHLKNALAAFLRDHLGLELSAEKTRITHIASGYDFLGLTVKRRKGRQGGLLIRPSTQSVMKLKANIKAMTKRGTTSDAVGDKIAAMSRLLRSWANCFRHSAASRTLGDVSRYAFKRMEIWLRKKTRRRKQAIYRQYYRKHDRYRTWSAEGAALYHPGASAKIGHIRHTHRSNPYLNERKRRTCGKQVGRLLAGITP